MSARKQPVRNMRADEAGPPGDEHLHAKDEASTALEPIPLAPLHEIQVASTAVNDRFGGLAELENRFHTELPL